MSEFVLELYVSRTDPKAVGAGDARARRAAEELSREGVRVRFLGTLYLPEEETCFYRYEASSAEQVRAAVERAGLPAEPIVEAISDVGS
jgi:hypothetical protein